MPSNHLILCCPHLPPSIFPSIRVFSSESVLHIRWPEYWNFSFSISPSNEYSGLMSFRMDWLDLLAVQGTLKSLLQHHSSKASEPTYRGSNWRAQGQEGSSAFDEDRIAERSHLWDLGLEKVTVRVSTSGTPGRKRTGREGCPVSCMFWGFFVSEEDIYYKNCEINLVFSLRLLTFYLAR